MVAVLEGRFAPEGLEAAATPGEEAVEETTHGERLAVHPADQLEGRADRVDSPSRVAGAVNR